MTEIKNLGSIVAGDGGENDRIAIAIIVPAVSSGSTGG